MGSRPRYTTEQLLALAGSPLSKIRPPGLPPAEEWMGPPPDNPRKSGGLNHHDSASLLDHIARKPAMDRQASRGNTSSGPIVLGPPKTSFASATLRSANKGHDLPDKPPLPRDPDSRDRFDFRNENRENERARDGRTNLRAKRTDGDQDSDGWSTVKPRKSFGTEGAERFNGRMGGDRHRERDDRNRFREREERDAKDRPARGFGNVSRNNDGDGEQESGRRNGLGRARGDSSRFKDNEPHLSSENRKSAGDRFADRNRGWREKDPDDRPRERDFDRGHDRRDRRWDRDNDRNDDRQERDPEWMDEPGEKKDVARTAEDFERWKAETKRKEAGEPALDTPKDTGAGQGSFFGLEKPKVETPLAVESGPDKFFAKYVQQEQEDDWGISSKKEGPVKAKTMGKSSRFTSFFTTEESQRRQTEPPPVPALPSTLDFSSSGGDKEKEGFQRMMGMLSKLNGPSPAQQQVSHPPPPPPPERQASAPAGPEMYQFRPERPEMPQLFSRESQPIMNQELYEQRPPPGNQSALPGQILQLVNQRQNALSQGSNRPQSDSEHLLELLKNPRATHEPHRLEQPNNVVRPEQLLRQFPPMNELEQQERERLQRQQRRPAAPPGFFDDAQFQLRPMQHEPQRSQAPSQPTAILQRPPGLDQPPPPPQQNWNPPTQLPPPMNPRHVGPPPGLNAGPPRAMPLPQSMFPPGFPMNNFGPPPDGMQGPPRGMPPPPGFMMPPPGFLTPPGFPNLDGIPFNGPYDGRGAPPPGFRRQ